MKKTDQGLPHDALTTYAAIAAQFCLLLRQRPLYARVISAVRIENEIRRFHEQLDAIGSAVGQSDTTEWKTQCDKDHVAMHAAIDAAVIKTDSVSLDVRDARAQREALTVLKFEIAKDEKHDVTTRVWMDKLYAAIRQAAGGQDVVVPWWFVSREDVAFNDEDYTSSNDACFARGSFGSLYRGTRAPDQRVVVKVLAIDDPTAAVKPSLLNELDMWYTLHHPHILSIVGACHVQMPPFVVYEDASCVNLASFLAASTDNKTHLWRLLYEAARGLEYLHQHKIVHGHLMLANILVDANGAARLSDYGLSAVRASAKPSTDGSVVQRVRWCAPECLDGSPTAASDVYALGMCVIEATTGAVPFAGADDDIVRRLVLNGTIPPRPSQLSDKVWQLVEGMTQIDALRRMPLERVIAGLKELVPPEQLPRDLSADATDIPALLKTVEKGVRDDKRQALSMLFRASATSAGCDTIARANGIPTLWGHTADNKAVDLTIRLLASGCLWRMQFLGCDSVTPRALESTCFRICTMPEMKGTSKELTASASEDEVLDVLGKAECALQTTYTAPDHLFGVGFNEQIIKLLSASSGRVFDAACRVIGTRSFCYNINASSALGSSLVQRLKEVIQHGEAEEKLSALFALGQLSDYRNGIRETSFDEHVIEGIVPFLASENFEHKIKAANGLQHLLWSGTLRKVIENAGVEHVLVDALRTGTDFQIGKVLAVLTRRVSDRLFMKLNGVQLVVSLLQHGTPYQRHRAASVLVELARNGHREAEQAGAIRALVQFVRDREQPERLAGVLALKEMANYSTQSAILIHEAHGVEAVVAFLQASPENVDVQEEILNTLQVLTKYSPNYASLVEAGGIKLLNELLGKSSLHHRANELLTQLPQYLDETDATWTLSRPRPTLNARNINNDGSCESPNSAQRMERLVEELCWDETLTDVRLRGLDRVIRMRTSHAALVACGGINILVEFLEVGSDEQKEMAARSLLCLASDPANHSAITAAGAVGSLISMLRSGANTQNEVAVHVLGQLASDESVVLQLDREGAANDVIEIIRLDGPASDDASSLLLAIAGKAWSASVDKVLIEELIDILRRAPSALKMHASSILFSLAQTSSCSVASMRALVLELTDRLTAESVRKQQIAVKIISRLARSGDRRLVQALVAKDVLDALVPLTEVDDSYLQRAANAALEQLAKRCHAHDVLEFHHLMRLGRRHEWARVAMHESLCKSSSRKRELACGLALALDQLGKAQETDGLHARLDAAWTSLVEYDDDAMLVAAEAFVDAVVESAHLAFDRVAWLCQLAAFPEWHSLLLKSNGGVDILLQTVTGTEDPSKDVITAIAAIILHSSVDARQALLRTDGVEALVRIAFDTPSRDAASAVVHLAQYPDCLSIIQAQKHGIDVIERVTENGAIDDRIVARKLLRSMLRPLAVPTAGA